VEDKTLKTRQKGTNITGKKKPVCHRLAILRVVVRIGKAVNER
jgi:hypothetical protein